MKLGLRIVERGNPRDPLLQLALQVRKGIDVRVGVVDEGREEGDTTNSELAALHEFGSEGGLIPERSFLRSTMKRQRQPWFKFLAARMRKVVAGQMGAVQAMDQLGIKMADDTKATITAGIDPENAPSTIAAKGSSTPLVDSSQLRESISHQLMVGGVKQ